MGHVRFPPALANSLRHGLGSAFPGEPGGHDVRAGLGKGPADEWTGLARSPGNQNSRIIEPRGDHVNAFPETPRQGFLCGPDAP